MIALLFNVVTAAAASNLEITPLVDAPAAGRTLFRARDGVEVSFEVCPSRDWSPIDLRACTRAGARLADRDETYRDLEQDLVVSPAPEGRREPRGHHRG